MPAKQGWPDFHLASGHLSGEWDKDNPKYRLNFILFCGSENVNVRSRKYQANLKQCLVAHYSEGCQVDVSSVYSYEEKLKWKLKEARHSEVSSEVSSESKIALAGTAESIWTRFLARIKVGALWKAKSRVTADETINIDKLFRLISYRGGYWAVGDDRYGDARNKEYADPKPSWLRGKYFGEDPIKPLCTVDLLNGHAKGKVTVIVWALPGQISLYQISLYKLGADGGLKREARWGSRRKALEALGSKATLRMRAVTKARRAALPKGLPPIDKELPSEAYPLALDALTVHQA